MCFRNPLISVLFVAIACLCISCNDADLSESIQPDYVITSGTKAAEELYYHQGTGLLIKPVDMKVKKLKIGDPSATHIAVIFYPKDLNEQIRLSNDKNISISHIPFGYAPVPVSVQKERKIKNYPVFPEEL